MRSDLLTPARAFLLWLWYRRESPSLPLLPPLPPSPPSTLSGRSSPHMAAPGEHTDVLDVISASQTPSFNQLRSLNPRLAVLFPGRLLSNSPPPNQKHIMSHSSCLRAGPTAGQVKEIRKRKWGNEQSELSELRRNQASELEEHMPGHVIDNVPQSESYLISL